MWSMRKLSLFQMLSGTWKVNDHLPQQDWAPGLWAPASPTAWRAEPSGEGPRNAQCRGGAQGWSCWQSWCLGATAPVSILPAPQKAKPPTLQLFIGLRDHTIPEHTPRQSCSIGWFLKREESLQASHHDPPAEDRPQHFYSFLLRLHKGVWTHQRFSLRAHRKTASDERNFLFFFPLVWSGLFFVLQAVNLIKSLPTK